MATFTIVLRESGRERVECEKWVVKEGFVVFGNQLGTTVERIQLAVAKGSVLFIRREDSDSPE